MLTRRDMLAAMAAGAAFPAALPRAANSKVSQGASASTDEDPHTIIARELKRTQPDYVVYCPKSIDGSSFDTGNEHFLVFDGPDGSLMAVWTQSSYEGGGDHRIVFARSDDEGVTWSVPHLIAGPTRPGAGLMASWGFPLVSRMNRIYIVWNQQTKLSDYSPQITGTMDACYSDDMGRTWSEPQTVPMPKSRYDHPDPEMPSNWIVWQKPFRDLNNRWFTGFTRWVSPKVRTKPHINSWTAAESVVQFMRFENVDDHPEPRDLRVIYSPDDKALRVPHYINPLLSIAQEPSIVRLPDGRLFCTMRTMSGCIWYSVSSDDAESWHSPRPLLRCDYGLPVLQPLCCCPIYEYDPGRYILLHHNNDGRFEGCMPEDTNRNRRPAFIALGEYRAAAEQPIWFSESRQLMDNDGFGIGPLNRIDVGVYPSVTNRKGNYVLWHPDRKFFLLGKRITPDFLAGLSVPEFRG